MKRAQFCMIRRKVNLASLLVDIRRGLITPELQLRRTTILQATNMDHYLQEEFMCSRKDMHVSTWYISCSVSPNKFQPDATNKGILLKEIKTVCPSP
jgi:hypothetical protein